MSINIVCVLHYGNPDITIQAIKSVVLQKFCTFKLLVVDNDPQNRLKQENLLNIDKNIELIVSEENFGYAAGNNIAIKKAKEMGSKYFLIFNNDAEMKGETLISESFNFMDGNENLAILAPKTLNEPKDSGYYLMLLKVCGFKINSKKGSNITYHATVSGAAIILRMSAVLKVGEFNEAYFLYCEEDEYCLRMIMAGYDVGAINISENVVLHLNKEERNENVSWVIELVARNRFVQLCFLGIKVKLLILPLLMASEFYSCFRLEGKFKFEKMRGWVKGFIIYMNTFYKKRDPNFQRELCKQGKEIMMGRYF